MPESVYTTINPNTGELTKDHEYVNAWKWNPSVPKDFKNYDDYKASLCRQEELDPNTPVRSAQKVIELRRAAEESITNYQIEVRRNSEYLLALENTSIQIKDLIADKKAIKKKTKQDMRKIGSYLAHKQNCRITTMEDIGRVKNKVKCNCGLNETLESLKSNNEPN
jgi:hypothetical protein